MTANITEDSDRLARSTTLRRRDLPRAVWLLVGARAVNRMGAFTLSFLGVILVQELGASVADAGWVLTLFGLATIPSRLAGGSLADRFGRVPTTVLGLTCSGLALLWLAASPSMAVAGAGAVALGLAFELYEPPSQALVADLTDDASRPVAFGLLSAALAAAGAAAGLLAAAVGGLGLRWLLVADAVTCLLAALVVLLGVRDRRPLTAGKALAEGGDFGRSPWRDRRLLAMLGGGTGFAVVYLAMVVALPLTVAARNLPPERTGLLLTISAVTIVAGQPLLRWGLLGGDGFRAMTVGYVVLGAGLALTAVAASLPAFAVAVVIWSLGDLLLMGHAWTIVSRLAPASSRGRYLAACGISWGVAASVAPLVATQLLDRVGVSMTWLVLAVGAGLLACEQPALARLCRGTAA
ncbi:MFS transporter [soil metagenome]